jgi:hypothetical protein
MVLAAGGWEGLSSRELDASGADVLDQLMAGCDVIFQLAEYSSVYHSFSRPIAMHDVNLTTRLYEPNSATRHCLKQFLRRPISNRSHPVLFLSP